MSEYTDYFLARASNANALRDRLAQAHIPCLVADDAHAATSEAAQYWWPVLAASTTNVAPPAGRASRAEVMPSLAPLVTVDIPDMYRRDIVAELCAAVAPLLQLTASEGAMEWSLALWERVGVEPALLDAALEEPDPFTETAREDSLHRVATALGLSPDTLRDHIVAGPGTIEAFTTLAQIPWMYMLDCNALPPATWLLEHGTAVLTSTLEG